ncbi:MAG: indole-3-glycerol phosphate synthase TrpC [Acidobacteria bacterium]|nr:indole-3-glycerol phosphate synthase TrpC [Acidobacteriota bacterium]
MADILAAIVAATRKIVENRRVSVPLATLERSIERSPTTRAFADALARADRINVIAECKRRSPSRGVLRRHYNAAEIARSYQSAGAAAVSVLTEPTFFDGSPEHLAAVRDAVSLPILRKDFIVDEYQLVEARAWGADAVLLIVAALEAEPLKTLLARARGVGLAALVEVHDRLELEIALGSGGEVVGVNNRNLKTLEVDLEASERLIEEIPDQVVAVAESGLQTRADLLRLRASGYDAFLIGEHLMTSADPGAGLRELLRDGVGQPS